MLAGVKAAEQPRRTGEPQLGEVAEARARARHLDATGGEQPQPCVPGEGAEADHDPQCVEFVDLPRGERQARVALEGRRLVLRRRAADGRGDPRAAQRQPVVRVS
jgi:hypothetical protein